MRVRMSNEDGSTTEGYVSSSREQDLMEFGNALNEWLSNMDESEVPGALLDLIGVIMGQRYAFHDDEPAEDGEDASKDV